MNEEGTTSTLSASAGASASVDSGAEHAEIAPLTSKEETVRRLLDAFNQRQILDALVLLHPEVIFQPMTAQVTQAGEPYCGHEGIRRYAADVEAQWDELILHPAQIRAAGQAVVALGMVSGSGRTGAFEDAPTTWVFKFKEGLVIHVQIFSEARNVFEALGGESA